MVAIMLSIKDYNSSLNGKKNKHTLHETKLNEKKQ